MAFWSSETLKNRLPNLIDDFRHERIKSGAYELSLGSQAVVTGSDPLRRTTIDKGEHFAIPPGQFAELLTSEAVSLPSDALGLISIKYRYKRRGLVNVSGFHVDPGYQGRLRFSVYNAGPAQIVMTGGDPTFLLWLASLDQATSDGYKGSHQNQTGISDEDVMSMRGEVLSPQDLRQRLDQMQHRIDLIERIAWLAIGIVATALLGAFISPITQTIKSALGGAEAVQTPGPQRVPDVAPQAAPLNAPSNGGAAVETLGNTGS